MTRCWLVMAHTDLSIYLSFGGIVKPAGQDQRMYSNSFALIFILIYAYYKGDIQTEDSEWVNGQALWDIKRRTIFDLYVLKWRYGDRLHNEYARIMLTGTVKYINNEWTEKKLAC